MAKGQLTSRKQHEARFIALADFANLGDTPEDWRRFRLKHPHFFPDSVPGLRHGFGTFTEWIYKSAEAWAKIGPEINNRRLAGSRMLPTLLWLRERLRAVWTRNDVHGINLNILLGFEKQAFEKIRQLATPPTIEGLMNYATLAQGEVSRKPDRLTDLPQAERRDILKTLEGIPEVDGLRGEIVWKFPFEFQQTLHELMKHRWRAMVCTCGKLFVADKSAQKHCSTECYAEAKRESGRTRWHEKGKAERAAKRRR